MALCPVHLDFCDRAECSGRHCADADEPKLAPCTECGYLIVMRGRGLCLECIAVELTVATES